MKPNQQLRRAREERGWSQQRVADEVGTTARTVSRWEAGLARPYPYYREKLCHLFERSIKELGLAPDEDLHERVAAPSSQLPEMQGSIETDTQKPGDNIQFPYKAAFPAIYDPAIPPPLTGQVALIGRDDLLSRIKQRLQGGNAVALTALNGLPGVGKTALAVAVSSDPEIQAHFHDGILWAGLGPQADIQGLLHHWGMVLGLTTDDLEGLQDKRDWLLALRCAIGQRRMLLIIDDAWKIEDALALQIGGPHCSYLITTRLASLAAQWTNDGVMPVRELNEQDGITLLGRFAPEVVAQEPEAAREMVRLVGGLPLAQVLMGRYLHIQAVSGRPRRLRRALSELESAERRLRQSLKVPPLTLPTNLANGASWSLQAAIAVSEEQLDEQARRALYALSVFPPKPNCFSEEAALAVSQVPIEVLDTLSDSGLLESREANYYTLHQTIADYARLRLNEQESSALDNLVDYYITCGQIERGHIELFMCEKNNVMAALNAAYASNAKERYILLLQAFGSDIYATEGGEVYAYHIQRAFAIALSSQKTDEMIAVLIESANLHHKQGRYEQGDEDSRRALSMIRPGEDHPLLGMIYLLWGMNALYQSNYPAYEERLKRALAIGREKQNSVVIVQANYALAFAALYQGKLEVLNEHVQEILTFAQGEDVGALLCYGSLLSQKEEQEGNFALAKHYAQRGLACATAIGFNELACYMLEPLMRIEMQEGNYKLANEYIEQGMMLARKENLIRHSAIMRLAKGELSLAQGHVEEAEEIFLHVQKQLPAGSKDVRAKLLYGLAELEFERRNEPVAKKYAQESLSIYREIGHYEGKRAQRLLERVEKEESTKI